MSTLTLTAHEAHAQAPKKTGRGFFRRLHDAIVAGRQARVRPVVLAALQQTSDENLTALGYSKEEIERIRKARVPFQPTLI